MVCVKVILYNDVWSAAGNYLCGESGVKNLNDLWRLDFCF